MKKSLTKLFTLLGAFLLLGVGSANAWYLNVPGGHNNWGDNGTEWSGDRGYNTVPIGVNEFKIRIWDGSEHWYANGETSLELYRWYDIWGDGNNMKINSSIAKTNAKYKITWISPKEKGNGEKEPGRMWISDEYPPQIYMVGFVNGEKFNPTNTYALKRQGSTSKYEATLNIGSECGDAYFSFAEAVAKDGGDWDGLGLRYGANNDGAIPDYIKGAEVETVEFETNNAFKVPAGNYTVSFDLSSKKFTIEQNSVIGPDNLYLYGDLKESSWKERDFYQAANENGIYKFTDVYVRGEKNNKNENYIAFFSSVDTDSDNEMDYETMLPRFGCADSEVTDGYTNVWVSDFNKSYKLVGYAENNKYNFCLPQGIYDIEVNLNTMQIKFTQVDLSYQWFDHEGSQIESGVHETTYGVNNKVQIGARDDVRHAVADLARFKVEYEPAQSNNGKGAKARAQEVTGDDEYVTIDDDYLLTLHKVGNYTIEASLPTDNSSEYYDVQPTTLNVSVAAANVEVTADGDTKEFNPKSNTYTLSVSFDNSEITTSDFNLTIAPQNNAEGWVKLSDYQTDGGSVEAAYEAALCSDLYNHQYLQLVGNGNYIDGFYTELSEPQINKVNGEFTITQEFPCSGVYEMTISPIENGNYYFDTKVATFTITPNLKAVLNQTYENDGQSSLRDASTFNINGYGFTATNTETINYPGSIATVEELKKSVAYKPGIYFDDSFTITFGDKEYSDPGVVDGPSALADEPSLAKNTNWIDFDFSALAPSNSTIGVTATVVKNGATGTNTMTVVNNPNTETGVDSVEAAEDGEAVYYNLQGVRVENPTHGIYVKVVDGKAVKVVL